MKIKSLAISGMHHISKPKSYTFQDINYLFGHNGAGKSTVLQAIQLAILGYIPGTAKPVSSIFKHANGPEMKIKIEFDSGNYIERTWRQKGRSIDSKVDTNLACADNPAEILGDLELPIFNFNELIGMTANKLKDWFINFLPTASDNINWKKELEDSLNGLNLMDGSLMDTVMKDVQTADTNTDSTIEMIQSLNESWKEELSYLKSELSRSDSTIQSLVFYDEDGLTGDEEYLQEEINSTHASIQQLTLEKEQVIQASQIIQSNSNIRNQLASLPKVDTSSIENLKSQYQSELTAYQNSLTKIAEEESELQKLLQEGYAIDANISTKQGIVQSSGICPYTQTSCDSILTMVEQFKLEIDEMKTKKLGLQQQIQSMQTKIQQMKTDGAKHQLSANQLNNQISQIESAATSRQKLEALIAEEPDMSKFRDLQYYTTTIAALHERITKIEANKRYSSLIDKLTAEKYKLENSIEAYKCWIKLTDPNGLQTKVMDEPFKNLAEDMDRYLHVMFSSTEISCKFNLEHKANSFSFGLRKNDKYIPYDLLSSGEKTMYTLALMLCIIDKSSSKVKVLISDDMLDHLDDDRADEVFSAISKIQDIQVILAGVKKSTQAESYTIHVS